MKLILKSLLLESIDKLDLSGNQPFIEISSEPIYYKKQIPYYLLTCKSKNQKLLRICYLLSEVIYISSASNNLELQNFLISIQCIQPFWKSIKLLIIIKTIISQDHYYEFTATKTQDSNQQNFKKLSKQGLSLTRNSNLQSSIYSSSYADNNQLSLSKYFTKILQINNQVVKNIQQIVDIFQQLKYQQGSYLLPNIINYIVNIVDLQSTKNYRKSQNKIILQDIYNENVNKSLQRIIQFCVNSYKELLTLQFKQTKVHQMKQLRILLTTIYDTIQQLFYNETEYFMYEPPYTKYYQQLNLRIKQQELKVIELVQKCSIEHSMRKFNKYEEQQYIQFNTLVGIPDNLLHQIFVSYEAYQLVMDTKSEEIFKTLIKNPKYQIRKKKKSANFINNDKQMLINIEERIAIYKAKKNALQQQIRLCQQEDQKLVEVQNGLEIQLKIKKEEDLQKTFVQKQLFNKDFKINTIQSQPNSY